MTKPKAINRKRLVAFGFPILVKGVDLMPSEKSENLKHERYAAEGKLTAAKHKEKQPESEIKRLTRSERRRFDCLNWKHLSRKHFYLSPGPKKIKTLPEPAA